MAKLDRYVQKLFGSSASANEMAQFGSFAAGTPLRYSGATINPDIIQALSNYLTGWVGAVVGNNSPLLEDMNSLCYLFAYQLTYLFQAGVPEWDTDTIYYENSMANVDGVLYRSLTDNNTGNDPSTDGDNWGAPVFPELVSLLATSGNVTIPSGQNWITGVQTISTGDTATIASGAWFFGQDTLTINGTMVVNGTSRVL